MDFWDNMPPLEDGGFDDEDEIIPYGTGALTGRERPYEEREGNGMPEPPKRYLPATIREYAERTAAAARKRGRKRLAAGITAAFMVIVLLVVGIVFRDMFFGGPATPADGLPGDGDTDYHQDEPAVTFSPRDARRYLGSKDIAWETNIGGPGDDVLGEVMEVNDLYYLFGTTNSDNYDFKAQDTGDLFLSTMNPAGRILTASSFGTDYKDTFVKVRFNDNGFYLLSMTGTSRPSATVFNIGFDGTVKDAFTFPSSRGVYPKDLYVARNAVYVCGEIENQINGLKSPVFFALDNALNLQWYQMPDATSFEFVAMYPAADGFVALFNGDIAGQKYPALCRFTKLASTEFFYLKQRTSGNNVFATDMIPSDNGSFLIFLSDEADELLGSVIKVSAALTQTRKVSTEIKQCSGGKFFFGEGDTFYAICGYVAGARGRLVVDGVSGLSVNRVDSLNDIGTPREHTINTGRVLFLSATEASPLDNIMITAIDGSFTKQYQNTYGGKGTDSAVAFYTVSDGLIVFGYTDSQDGDIGLNRGRNDVWIFKIKAV